MTRGHERAFVELERLHAADPDGFEIVGKPEVIGGRLVATVSLRIGLVETAEGGLHLREREDFTLRVPEDFPFAYPSLSVKHDRFAGFPHVVWKYGICLYPSPASWNPRDGLFGFFDSLRRWLWKAAINDMDPVEGPLEPPHHVTAFSQRPFVVRANAPVVPGQRWLGFARLEKHANRIDLVGWVDWDDPWPRLGEGAFAIMLREALPMEFPRTGLEFFAELDKQGIERRLIIALLACAASVTPDDEPIHLVVGLPMRRAVDGSCRQHLAVWTTTAALTKSLRNTIGKEEDAQKLRDIREDLADAIYSIMESSKIAWCRILEDRPEIVVRRDHDTPAAWFLDKNVLLLGCGGLGSWIAEAVARAGARTVQLLDNAIVAPGLLTRQNYCLNDISAPKAEALATRLGAIAPTLATESLVGDAHRFIMEDTARFQSYDVVIDCTASSLFQMKLERDWMTFGGKTPRLISIGVDATANRCLAITVPANSPGGIWDAYVQLKRQLCLPGANADIIGAFYSEHADRQLFQPEPGCSDPTFHGSTVDVWSLGATALNLAIPQLLESASPTGIAFAAHTPETSQAHSQIVRLCPLQEIVAGQYRIRVAPNVYSETRAWVEQNNRMRSGKHETGGLLWGLWDDAVSVIWVFDASGPPPDSRHDPGHFVCGVEGTIDEHERRCLQSFGVCGFIGMWHTHPEVPAEQSLTDIAGMATLVSGMGRNQRRALMVIFGRVATQPMTGFYVYESQARTSSQELVSVGVGHATPEVSVV